MPYKIYLCGENPSYALDPCPGGHIPEPTGYVEWHDWAKMMGKTHKQSKCKVCGKYAIWTEKS